MTLRQKILPIQQFEGEIDYEVQQQREPRPVGPQWSYHYFTGILSPNLFRREELVELEEMRTQRFRSTISIERPLSLPDGREWGR